MTTVTSNVYIGPQDNWVQLAATAATFTRVSGYPHTHPYQLFYGSAAPSLTPVQATGTVTFTGLPTAGQTVTIGSEVYTFRAAAALPFEVTIGADATAMGVNFVSTVTANSALVTATTVTGTVTVTAKAPGVSGNYVLSDTATNTATAGMTGGADVVEGVTICHKPFWMNVLSAQPLWARVKNPVSGSRYNDGKLRLDVIVTI